MYSPPTLTLSHLQLDLPPARPAGTATSSTPETCLSHIFALLVPVLAARLGFGGSALDEHGFAALGGHLAGDVGGGAALAPEARVGDVFACAFLRSRTAFCGGAHKRAFLSPLQETCVRGGREGKGCRGAYLLFDGDRCSPLMGIFDVSNARLSAVGDCSSLRIDDV